MVTAMTQLEPTIAQQLAQVAKSLQEQRTGHAPKSVTVVLNEDTLVVTLHEALTPAERALAQTPAGAAQVQEFHRQLFSNASDELRREIKRITGRDVREAVAEVEAETGTVVHAFTTGTMVQVFLLAKSRAAETGSDAELDRWANDTGQEALPPSKLAAAGPASEPTRRDAS